MTPSGLVLAFGYVLSGVLMMITVIGIPFGVQSFKMAKLALSPFGKEIVKRKAVANALEAAKSSVD